MLISTVGLVGNFVAVLGCLSDATSTIHLYKLEQSDLLAAIEIVTNTSAKSFENSALPNAWYWASQVSPPTLLRAEAWQVKYDSG